MFQPPKEYRVIDHVERRRQIQGDQDVGLLGVNSLEQIVIFSSAVSVEWCWRYADWSGQKLPETRGISRLMNRHSRTLLIVLRLEIGL